MEPLARQDEPLLMHCHAHAVCIGVLLHPSFQITMVVTEVIANYTLASGRKERAFSSCLWVTQTRPRHLRMEPNESNARQMALVPRNSRPLASAHGQALPFKASLLNR